MSEHRERWPNSDDPGLVIHVFLSHATIKAMTVEEWKRVWTAYGTIVRTAAVVRLRREKQAEKEPAA